MHGVTIATEDGVLRLEESSTPPVRGPAIHLARGREGLWAIIRGREVWRAPEGSWPDHWERMAEVEGLRANCLLRLPDGALVGTSQARLLRLDPAGLAPVPGFDRAEGRERWFTPWGGPPDVRSLAAGPDGTLYANVHVGGILRSSDGGTTWAPTSLEIEADVHQVVADPRAPGTVLAATAYGLAVSRDAGDGWELYEEGLHATYCRAVALTDDGPLVSASRGHHGRDAAVYRFRDRFERCREGLPEWFSDNVDTHCLDAAGTVAALGTADGSVYLSRDAGATWERVAEGLPAIRSVLLTDDPPT